MKKAVKSKWTTKYLSSSQQEKLRAQPGLSAFWTEVERFGDYLITERNFSMNTAEAYGLDLALFLAWVADQGKDLTPAGLDADWVRGFLASGRAWSPSTRARRVSAIKAFAKYLLKKGVLSADPLSTVSTGRQPKRLPRPLSEDEMKRLLEAPGPSPLVLATKP